jgi:hypothetical protein
MALLLLVLASQVTLTEGTELIVRLDQAVSSKTVRVGDPVRLSVVNDVTLGQCNVISRDAVVEGYVIVARRKASFGRDGAIAIAVGRVKAAGGSWLRLRRGPAKPATPVTDSHSTAATTFGLLWYAPVAPVAALFAKGHDVSIPKAARFTVYTDESFTIPAECR